MKKLFKDEDGPFLNAEQGGATETSNVDEELLEEWRQNIAAAIPKVITHYPSMSGPGPAGSRFEHWATLQERPDGLADAGEAFGRLLLGEVPAEILDAHLGGRLLAAQKPGGAGVRPLACGSVLRRIAAKAVCKTSKKILKEASGPFQFGVGCEAGVEKVHKALSALAEVRPSAAFIALDCTNAFGSINRGALRSAARNLCPSLAWVAEHWYRKPVQHLWWDKQGQAHEVPAARGVDQGCPLSPAAFAITIASPLQRIKDRLIQLDAQAHVLAYLDDVYLIVAAEWAAEAACIAQEELGSVGLELNRAKTKAWTPDPTVELPGQVPRVHAMRCLGNTVPYVAAAVEAGILEEGAAQLEVMGPQPLDSTLSALHIFVEHVQRLRSAGLKMHYCLVLLRAFVVGGSTHIIRASLASEQWCKQFDERVAQAQEQMLQCSLDEHQRTQTTLPFKHGGCGLASVEARREAALLGSWSQCLAEVASSLGFTSASDFQAATPVLCASVAQAVVDIQKKGATCSFDWVTRFSEPKRGVQRSLTVEVVEARSEKLLAEVEAADAADILSAGDVSAGSFMLPPQDETHHMADDHFTVAVRRRLRVPHPALNGGLRLATQCQHRTRQGGICGQALDSRGHHAGTCKSGGGVVEEHAGVRDFLATYVADATGKPTRTEQVVPTWARVKRNGETEEAGLDVAFVDGRGRRAYIDVAVVTASTPDQERLRRRARDGGAAAAAHEDVKRIRYPGPELVPFVVESLGRPGLAAQRLMRTLAPKDMAERGAVLGKAWQTLSVLMQTQLAERLITASRRSTVLH